MTLDDFKVISFILCFILTTSVTQESNCFTDYRYSQWTEGTGGTPFASITAPVIYSSFPCRWRLDGDSRSENSRISAGSPVRPVAVCRKRYGSA